MESESAARLEEALKSKNQTPRTPANLIPKTQDANHLSFNEIAERKGRQAGDLLQGNPITKSASGEYNP